MSNAPRLSGAQLAQATHAWGTDTSGCTILHIDMDAFYASCEILRRPQLRGKPVIVGTGNRSVVSAASYEAREFGVRSAMPVATARRLCPQGIFLPVDMPYYRQKSHQVFQIFSSITDQVERTSVDEGYMDVAGALRIWKSPLDIAHYIRSEVFEQLGLTCSIGIASNRFVAKLASTQAKPNGMLLVPQARQAEFVQLLPLRALPGVGPSTCDKLATWGVTTTAQCAQLSLEQLRQITNSAAAAQFLYNACRGIGTKQLTLHAPERSIGQERTFPQDTRNTREVTTMLLHCSDHVASQLRKRQVVARTVTVKLRFADLRYATRSYTLPTATQSALVIFQTARTLCEQLLHMQPHALDATNPHMAVSLPELIRLAGVSVSHISDQKTTAIQASFDDLIEQEQSTPSTDDSVEGAESSRKTNPERFNHAQQALDAIRERYGTSAVHFGA